jgi:hypothetical protein
MEPISESRDSVLLISTGSFNIAFFFVILHTLRMNLTAELFPIGNQYNVVFHGDVVIEGSRDPETDLARVLEACGLSGTVTVVDGKTGRPRTIINIEKAAKLRAEEGPNAPRFVKYRCQTVGAGPYRREKGRLGSSILIETSS